MDAGLTAVDARRLVLRALEAEPFATDPRARVHVIAVGKASAGMADAAFRWFGPRIIRGLVVAPQTMLVDGPFDVIVGGHPVPTEESATAAERAIALARGASPSDLLLVLLSGGASALLALPADRLTLDDKQRTTATLLRAGAEIGALNAVRKHLSAVKGGQLAAAADAPTRTLVISDVVGDPLDVIGSGLTVPDSSTFTDALRALSLAAPLETFPRAVVTRLERGVAGAIVETPKPGDIRLQRSRAAVIGGRHDAMRGAVVEAERRGYEAIALESPIVGEARLAGAALAATWARHARDRGRPICVVSSGETTVRVTGAGRGGRNQELALALVEHLSDVRGPFAAASVGTDGVDGPTDAAGGVVDGDTPSRASTLGLPPPSTFLADNNAYRFFEALGDLVITGPTGTNVGDLQVALFS